MDPIKSDCNHVWSLTLLFRFIFVSGSNNGEPSLPQLMKSSKTASEALNSVLHLDDDNTAVDLIASDMVADLNCDGSLK